MPTDLNPNQFVVRLEAGVWLTDDQFEDPVAEPGRTLVEANARRFDSHADAVCAITAARQFRSFINACVRTVPRVAA